MNSLYNKHLSAEHNWVRESRFGRWFLRSNTWYRYVLSEAVLDFKRLLSRRDHNTQRILDAGCGEGIAFPLLIEHLRPSRIDGIDIDVEQLQRARSRLLASNCNVELTHTNASQTPFEDDTFDLIFAHQLLHHTTEQIPTLREFHRILKPGGWLLSAESCEAFIHTPLVRWFFRHPMHMQRDSQGYVDLIRSQGFELSDADIQRTIPWWSLSDLGILRRLGIQRPRDKQVTEVLSIARKPLAC